MNQRKCETCNVWLWFAYEGEERSDGILLENPKNESERANSSWWLSALDDADFTLTEELTQRDVGGEDFSFCPDCQEYIFKNLIPFEEDYCEKCLDYLSECKCKTGSKKNYTTKEKGKKNE